MKNRDVYLRDPSTLKLVNEGVAKVDDDPSIQALEVLRYELETFVCEGQYEKGLRDILDAFLRNIDAAQQPGVWVSGFYGSGKSHLLKVLRALWVDLRLPGGATARGVTNLPPSITDLLAELSTQGKRHGGLHAASGTLGSAAKGSVRLALLRIIFRSVGLPEEYYKARFVMWLQSQGIYERVRERVTALGGDWQEELDNFYLAEVLHRVLVETKPEIFSTPAICTQALLNQYPHVNDVSRDDMVDAVKQALSRGGKMPLTLVAVDEVQQYIGDSGERALEVQEAVESCCKDFGGKLMFVGSGQTAITGTHSLQKLEGRFTVRVQLSDADVASVVRKVLLAKKPQAVPEIERMMETNLGEVSRHLGGSRIGYCKDDAAFFAADYALLPVRRRFWEVALRALDQTGTVSQLRNQLIMVHKAIQNNLDEPLGNVVPADFLYAEQADSLLQSRILPRELYDKTRKGLEGGGEGRLAARACGLVFLINKITDQDRELGLRATVDSLADLMVDDLVRGSEDLRRRLPSLLDNSGLLIKVGDEYRVQTPESAEWLCEFEHQRAVLMSESYRIDAERSERIRDGFGRLFKKKLTLEHGASKVERELHLCFEASPPANADRRLCVWVRDGWSTDEQSVMVEARQAGMESATVHVFVPRLHSDELRRQLLDMLAAKTTLDRRGVPSAPEGMEARAAMETNRQAAENRVCELVDEIIAAARVFQGGGSEIQAPDLASALREAAANSLKRLYPNFSQADHPDWGKALGRAQKGDVDALKAVGWNEEADRHPVCREVLQFLGTGKKGADIRSHFEGPGYGWPRDAVDGALQALLVAGTVRAEDETGSTIAPAKLERRAMGKAMFKMESALLLPRQRLEVRRLLQQMGVKFQPDQEGAAVPSFLRQVKELAAAAGGEGPLPSPADTSVIDEIAAASGNEQLLALFNARERLTADIAAWEERKRLIASRLPKWQLLEELLRHAAGLEECTTIRESANAIRDQRMLLADPDPVTPLLQGIVESLRRELIHVLDEYDRGHAAGMASLQSDAAWDGLEPEQQEGLLRRYQLATDQRPAVRVQDPHEVLDTLRCCPLPALRDRVAALPARFDQVRQEAARLAQPEVQFVPMPRRTLNSMDELEQWLAEVRAAVLAVLQRGPVGIC